MNIPVVALKALTVFPDMVIHFDIQRKKGIAAVKSGLKSDGQVFVITQKEPSINNVTRDNLYNIGTLVKVRQITKLPGNIFRVMVEGIARARLNSLDENEKRFLYGDIDIIEEDNGRISDDANYEEAAIRTLYENLMSYAKFFPKVSQSLSSQVDFDMSLSKCMNNIAVNIPIPYEKKQMLLECISTKERYALLSKILIEETNIARIHEKIATEIKESVSKNQKEYVLREQLAFIKKELSNGDELTDSERYYKQLEELEASDFIKEKIKKEIRRFENTPDRGNEGAVQRNYIECLLEMPWDHKSIDRQDILIAEKILNEDHFGMDKVKERILEFLAVRTLTAKGHSPIVCLVGPPGTGKTSIAKSVARALSKEYVRICLGGVRDEAEIRGHRRTYVGAMPGRIAGALKSSGVSNPLMLLDEIDKVSNDYKGDTFSALLEVLDPDQNTRFRDHYIELPLDLTDVLFIATANDTESIPRPLLDRMEIIEVSGYTANEKFHIAKEHLLKKQFEQNGMTGKMLKISDSAIKDIISYYTREAGVRELERKLGEICRKVAKEILSKDEPVKISVTGKNLKSYLGKRKYFDNPANKKDEVGIVRGLAWTVVGGETLEIEVNIMPGKGELCLTGQMGDVMKESAEIALSYIRSISESFGIEASTYSENDFHIHIPEGAVPKDGPSAGITMATALLSAVINKKVHANVAMTGEVNLRGRVLPIGGLKEKLLAANTAGIKKVLVPKENEKDVIELSDEIIGDMKIVYVSDMKEVISEAIIM